MPKSTTEEAQMTVSNWSQNTNGIVVRAFQIPIIEQEKKIFRTRRMRPIPKKLKGPLNLPSQLTKRITTMKHSKRLALYQQPVWECEITGKKNLTYQQALESERLEQYRADAKLPKVLRKAILARVEYQTSEFNTLVEDVMNTFKDNFVVGEIVYCNLNNNNYFARIVDVFVENKPQIVEPPAETLRQTNGRLRFPEAFLQPSSTPEDTHDSQRNVYRVQLIDENGRALEEYIRTVGGNSIRRESGMFSRVNVQNFILESFQKNTQQNAPWLLRPNTTTRYYTNSEYSNGSQQLQIGIFHSNKKQKTLQRKTIEERLNERQTEERKRQEIVRYPLEDLDLPDYRKGPSPNSTIIDMASPKYSGDQVIPYPSGGRISRPPAHTASLIPSELFDTFLSSWSFLTVFGEPLKISVYSLDEFEESLLNATIQPRPNVLVEYHSCLLNAIIKERNDDSVNEVIKGHVANSYIDALEEQEEMDTDSKNDSASKDSASLLPRVERGWQDNEHLKISEKWDHKEIRSSSDRRGWMTSLIGCLNDVATPDMIPELDNILRHLVPRIGSTAAEREKQYISLSLEHKFDIIQFLVNTVIESNLIRNHMEHCQEQMTEYRKQKSEVNKEIKYLCFKKFSTDRQDQGKKKTKTDTESVGENESTDDNNKGMVVDVKSPPDDNESAHKSSQNQTKKPMEWRTSMSPSDKKLEATEDQEKKDRADELLQLQEEEKMLKEKDKQLEMSLRRCMTLRMQNLGKDRFYNQYMYFDNIGLEDTCGSGRLYVHSPSDPDIQVMMDRDFMGDSPEVHYGYGGGRWFVLKLMKEQGLEEESEWLENRMKELESDNPSSYKSWWKCYSEPEEIEKLLSWVNPKGTREYQLKKELESQRSSIIDSIQRRKDTQS